MKITEFYEKVNGVSEESADAPIQVYCDAKGVKLPNEFNRFYQKNNGVIINDNDYEFVYKFSSGFWEKEDLRFQGFYSAEDMLFNLSEREGISVPNGMIPFVDIDLGSVCISVREDSFGEIYFCDEDPLPNQMPEGSIEAALKEFNSDVTKIPGIICKVADSFENFVESLELKEW